MLNKASINYELINYACSVPYSKSYNSISVDSLWINACQKVWFNVGNNGWLNNLLGMLAVVGLNSELRHKYRQYKI